MHADPRLHVLGNLFQEPCGLSRSLDETRHTTLPLHERRFAGHSRCSSARSVLARHLACESPPPSRLPPSSSASPRPQGVGQYTTRLRIAGPSRAATYTRERLAVGGPNVSCETASAGRAPSSSVLKSPAFGRELRADRSRAAVYCDTFTIDEVSIAGEKERNCSSNVRACASARNHGEILIAISLGHLVVSNFDQSWRYSVDAYAKRS